MISIEINGILYDAEPGQTILEIAQINNIEIPTLCYHKALNPYGGCRLCVVEILGDGWSKLATSCDLPVKEGLRIQTDSEKVFKSRKMTIELLNARCPNEQIMIELAAEYGIKKSRFKRDKDDCIKCDEERAFLDKVLGHKICKICIQKETEKIQKKKK